MKSSSWLVWSLTGAMIVAGLIMVQRGGHKTAQRAAQLEKCVVLALPTASEVTDPTNIHPAQDTLTKCLIMQYDWDGDSALAAGEAFQAVADSIERVAWDSVQAETKADLVRLLFLSPWAKCQQAVLLKGQGDKFKDRLDACDREFPIVKVTPGFDVKVSVVSEKPDVHHDHPTGCMVTWTAFATDSNIAVNYVVGLTQDPGGYWSGSVGHGNFYGSQKVHADHVLGKAESFTIGWSLTVPPWSGHWSKTGHRTFSNKVCS